MHINPGLEGLAFTNTRLSVMDGELGKLSFCGYDIHDLVERASYEEVCFLLWNRRLPVAADLFTTIFAVGRIAGGTAHMLEQHANNRLIRPRAVYQGPRDLSWVDIVDRKNGNA